MNNKLTAQEKFNAYCNHHALYEGVFIAALKTTHIFCHPTCQAQNPKIEQVVFFDSPQTALLNGFIPCKNCHPMEKRGETPEEIKKIIKALSENPFLALKTADLIQKNIIPQQIQQWFKKYHKFTFDTYQSLLRINVAFSQMKTSKSVVNQDYYAIFGNASIQTNKNIIHIVRFQTPIGLMFACATKKGICLLDFIDRKILAAEFKDLCKRLNAVILIGNNPLLRQVQAELKAYFMGKRKTFSLPLDTPSTPFRQLAWQVLQDIPYGETRSYKAQAIALGNPKAVRAVAAANGQNRVNILIPCHRVIGSNGRLVGYGGGLERKQWLLNLESNHGK